MLARRGARGDGATVQLYPIKIGAIFAQVDGYSMLAWRQVLAARGCALAIADVILRQRLYHDAAAVDLHIEGVVCAAAAVGAGFDLVGGGGRHLHAEADYMRGSIVFSAWFRISVPYLYKLMF